MKAQVNLSQTELKLIKSKIYELFNERKNDSIRISFVEIENTKEPKDNEILVYIKKTEIDKKKNGFGIFANNKINHFSFTNKNFDENEITNIDKYIYQFKEFKAIKNKSFSVKFTCHKRKNNYE